MQDASASGKVLRIAYLGPAASFSHQAAIEAFPENTPATHHPLHSFKDIFSAIQTLACSPTDAFDYAVLPIENSTNGSVVQVLDLLIQCGLDPSSCLFPGLEVVAEHYLEVHHCLYVHPSALPSLATIPEHPNKNEAQMTPPATVVPMSMLNITNVYSHPQVWGQCNNFLSANFPPFKVERIDVSSTSAAAVFVAQNPASSPSQQSASPSSSTEGGVSAAICSSLAGKANNLIQLASNIEDEPGQNTTRFLIVRNRNSNATLPHHLLQPIPTTPLKSQPVFHKSLLTFTIPHGEPGSLASALQNFSSHAVNLTAITTRPSRQRNWHYVFFVECQKAAEEGKESQPSISQELIRDLERSAERTCWLGSWVDRLDHR